MDKTPRDSALMTDRRRFLGAATAMGAIAATTGHGTAIGVSVANAQAPAGGAARTTATGPVLTRTIGRTNESLPALGLGTFLTFDLLPGRNRDALREVTRTYVDAGVRVIDTSPLYGTSEVSVGAFLNAMSMADRMFISNKIWSTGDYLADESHALASMEQSRLRLWRDKIDLFHCHSLVNVDAIVPLLRAWKKEGRIRYVGASVHENDYHPMLAGLIDKDLVDFIQVNYSIFNRNAEERILRAAMDKGVGVLTNMPLEKGRLHKIVDGRPLPEFARDIAAENWAQFFIKWAMGHPAVTTVLAATSNPDHAAENVGALRGPQPDQSMRQRMARHMESIAGFTNLAAMQWYPDKQGMYQGVIRRSQAAVRQRMS
ncbi:aldo/keto reductase [Bradyrhizobium murdochi]|uniref:aldo/keto reductase n=1 Tax=Bradyrhizobium murdochi TaxID=1038859 RepID=UPI00048680C4|nr:aldo/keto reductase [Bradyrhizobium murdochi]